MADLPHNGNCHCSACLAELANAALGPMLAPDQREVLLAMVGCNEVRIPYIRDLAAEVALPVERVRQIIRYFDSLGWVTHGPLYNHDDGTAAGSSWWLTDKGLAAQAALESAGA